MGCIDDSPAEVKAKFRAIKDNFDTTIFACGEADGTMCLICQDKKKSGNLFQNVWQKSNHLKVTQVHAAMWEVKSWLQQPLRRQLQPLPPLQAPLLQLRLAPPPPQKRA